MRVFGDIREIFFLLILVKNVCCDPHLNRRDETVQMKVATYGFTEK